MWSLPPGSGIDSNRYPSDLTDAQRAGLEPLLTSARSRRGRPRLHPLREIINAMSYVLPGELFRWLRTTYAVHGRGPAGTPLAPVNDEVRQTFRRGERRAAVPAEYAKVLGRG